MIISIYAVKSVLKVRFKLSIKYYFVFFAGMMVTLIKVEVNIDVFDNIHDNGHKKSVDFANHLDSIKTDDHDNMICCGTNVSSESRKRKIAHTFPQEKEKISRLPSDEVMFVDSDDELMKTHVFSPSESWQDKHE